jgi:hypothetical protein
MDKRTKLAIKRNDVATASFSVAFTINKAISMAFAAITEG